MQPSRPAAAWLLPRLPTMPSAASTPRGPGHGAAMLVVVCGVIPRDPLPCGMQWRAASSTSEQQRFTCRVMRQEGASAKLQCQAGMCSLCGVCIQSGGQSASQAGRLCCRQCRQVVLLAVQAEAGTEPGRPSACALVSPSLVARPSCVDRSSIL